MNTRLPEKAHRGQGRGRTIAGAAGERGEKIVDLMEALRASVEAMKSVRSEAGGTSDHTTGRFHRVVEDRRAPSSRRSSRPLGRRRRQWCALDLASMSFFRAAWYSS